MRIYLFTFGEGEIPSLRFLARAGKRSATRHRRDGYRPRMFAPHPDPLPGGERGKPVQV